MFLNRFQGQGAHMTAFVTEGGMQLTMAPDGADGAVTALVLNFDRKGLLVLQSWLAQAIEGTGGAPGPQTFADFVRAVEGAGGAPGPRGWSGEETLRRMQVDSNSGSAVLQAFAGLDQRREALDVETAKMRRGYTGEDAAAAAAREHAKAEPPDE